MNRIAITGGIAEGKSTVAAYLSEAGAAVASSDAMAREVFALPEVQAELAAMLGEPRPVTRDRVRAALALDPQVRRQVNRLMHPRIRERMRASEATFFEVPLLIEACLQDEYDLVWVVTCGRQEQLRRLAERLGDMDAARRLIEAQLPTRAKLAFADRIIRTNGSPMDVRGLVLEAMRLDAG